MYVIWCMDCKTEKKWKKDDGEEVLRFSSKKKAQECVDELNMDFNATFYTHWYEKEA